MWVVSPTEGMYDAAGPGGGLKRPGHDVWMGLALALALLRGHGGGRALALHNSCMGTI